MTLYFAYGSNLWKRGMLTRCPQARPFLAARLPGYRLQFQGYANIVADEKAAEAAVTKANADLTVAQARQAVRQREEETHRRIATQGVTVQQAEQMLTQARERARA